MLNNMLQRLDLSNVSVVIFDIDGTLKDLCIEHENALRLTLEQCGVRNINKKAVLFLNRMANAMVKMGVFTTNHVKQNILVLIYSIMAGVGVKRFSDVYYASYKEQICLFEGVYELLTQLGKEKQVYFATTNKQNYNMEECGILQERIVYKTGAFKVTTYKKLLKDIGIPKRAVLVIGDNIFDDILSAKFLGVKCLLVNHYNSKVKNVFCKLVNGKYLR